VAAHAHGADPKKRILFDREQHLFVGYHPSFAGNESRTYENGMAVVAMSMTKQQWDTMLEGQLDSNASRMLFASIEKESMEFCLQLEVETGIRRNGENLGSLNWRLKTLSHGAQGMGVEENKPQSKTFSVVTSRVGFLVGGHKIYIA
jgi:hypothetical protein